MAPLLNILNDDGDCNRPCGWHARLERSNIEQNDWYVQAVNTTIHTETWAATFLKSA